MKILHGRTRVILLSLLVSLTGCGGDEPPSEPVPVVRPVKVFEIDGSATGGTLSFPGRVAAGEQVDLAFRVGGPLIKLPVEEGNKVRKSEVVARIDPRDFRIRVNSMQAQFDKAEADIERLSALYEKDAASKAQLDQARASRDVAKANLDDAEADLSDTELRAPFAGDVGQIFIENFENVQSGQSILSLVGIDSIEIQVDLPESIVAGLRVQNRDNIEVYAEFDVAPGRKFPLEILALTSQADPQTQTYQATLTMPQPDGINILPGMTAKVSRPAPSNGPSTNSIIVPAIAIAGGDSNSAHVWIVDVGTMTVHRREVITGELVGTDRIRITDGVSAGEMIAVSAVSRLREGMQIRKMDE